MRVAYEDCSGLRLREQVISGQLHTLSLGRSIGFKKYEAILRGLSHKKWSCLDVLYIFNPPQPEQQYDICLFSLNNLVQKKREGEGKKMFLFFFAFWAHSKVESTKICDINCTLSWEKIQVSPNKGVWKRQNMPECVYFGLIWNSHWNVGQKVQQLCPGENDHRLGKYKDNLKCCPADSQLTQHIYRLCCIFAFASINIPCLKIFLCSSCLFWWKPKPVELNYILP